MAASDGRTNTRQSEDNSDFSRIENTLKNPALIAGLLPARFFML
jgi:hypothetical protein